MFCKLHIRISFFIIICIKKFYFENNFFFVVCLGFIFWLGNGITYNCILSTFCLPISLYWSNTKEEVWSIGGPLIDGCHQFGSISQCKYKNKRCCQRYTDLEKDSFLHLVLQAVKPFAGLMIKYMAHDWLLLRNRNSWKRQVLSIYPTRFL